MVNRADRRGLVDWLVQRFTAVIVGGYAVFILLFLLCHTSPSYAAWNALFENVVMRIATAVVMFSILWHAWIGLWTVFTDYVKNKPVRLLLEIIVIILLISYFIWMLEILWR